MEMRRLRTQIVSAAALVVFATSTAGAGVNERLSHPIAVCGLSPGYATDGAIQRLYGKGLFIADEDHGGGRYFVDPQHQITLHTTIGVDKVISLVECSEGVQLPSSDASSMKLAVTARLKPPKRIIRDLQFGASISDVKRVYGSPKRDETVHGERILQYSFKPNGGTSDYEYYVRFGFKRGRLAKVSAYNGE